MSPYIFISFIVILCFFALYFYSKSRKGVSKNDVGEKYELNALSGDNREVNTNAEEVLAIKPYDKRKRKRNIVVVGCFEWTEITDAFFGS